MPEIDDSPYRILQISDVHFGATFDPSLWEYIVALIRRERPQLVVCTGDIVDHGGLFMLAVARKQLEALPADAGSPHEFRCVPGNHDGGPWGNLRFRPFSTNFAALFGPEPMPLPGFVPSYLRYRRLPWVLRLITRTGLTVLLYAIKWFTALARLLRGRPSLAHLPLLRDPDPDRVALVYLDSNHTMRLATGNVDVRELTRLKSLVLNMRSDNGTRGFAPRIALVHHHPLPIADSKITEGLTSFEPFLVLRNAGILLRELNRCDVDLVLHGHKHYSSFARLGYSLDHRVEGEIAVLGAGSAGVTHSEAGRNSVNFIDVFRNGRMAYTAIFFGGGAGEPVTELFRNTRFVHGMEMHKMRVHRRAVERQGQCADKIVHDITLDSRGTALVCHEVEGLRFERDLPTTRLPVYVAVSMGRVPHVTLRLSERSLRLGHTWINPPTTPQRYIECAVELGQPLASASPPVDFGYEYLCFNTYAITEWETTKAYERDQRTGEQRGRAPGIEFTSLIVRAPVRELVLRVKLPPYSAAAEPEPMVRVMRWNAYPQLPLEASRQFRDGGQAAWTHDTDVSAHESSRLKRVAENQWELRVAYPLVGHRYDITWRVREAAEPEGERQSEVLRRGSTESYRRILLGLESRPAHKEAAADWLRSTREVVSPEFPPLSGGSSDLELALFVYDDARQELRLVLEHSDGNQGAPVVPFAVPLAEGVVGAALKRRAVVCYIDPALSGSRDDAAYLYEDRPERDWTQPKWKFVVAFPIFGLPNPIDAFASGMLDSRFSPAATVGVLTLASTATDSGLIRLTHPLIDPAAAPPPPPPPAPDPAAATGEAQAATEDAGTADKDVSLTYTMIWALAHLLLIRLKKASAGSVNSSAASSAPPTRPEDAGAKLPR